MSEDTHYELLGTEPGASRDELRDAYRARVEDLEAARERKGVTEKQLQQNRDEVARVRSAWNVLSDPFQRRRYDESLAAPAGASSDDVEILDDDDDAPRQEVALTGWRKFMAPPPPKNGSGKNPSRRPGPEPTISLPSGVRLAEPRARGMALMFDITVLLVIYIGASFVVPGLVKSDYKKVVDQVSNLNDLHDAQSNINDATAAIKSAKTASDRKSATSDLKSAQRDYATVAKDAKKHGVASSLIDGHSTKALQKRVDDLNRDLQGPQFTLQLTILFLALLYLVPMTARTGQTLGMRQRRIKVVRVDGSPVGWYATFLRFFIPVFVAVLFATSIGPIVALGIVLWGYRDRNRQGLHDKLAKTLVVAA